MKNIELFSSIPFPFMVNKIDPYELVLQSKEQFFDTPEYKKSNETLFKSIKDDGWMDCENGYSIYSRKILGSPRTILIVHGLKIKGKWKSKGKDDKFSIITPREKIVSYIDSLIKLFTDANKSISKEIDTKVKKLVTYNIHEIRSMNTNLYHASYELQNNLQYSSSNDAALAKNIVALSELISSRIDIADLSANESMLNTIKRKGNVSVYKKFEKVTKCYIAYAKKLNISISFSGSSNSEIIGIENFEMIPLIVIDNAVKYSPQNNAISISIEESNSSIICEITSNGPKIDEKEKEKIFDREFRGCHAIASGKDGNGIGLFFLKNLLSIIGGEISFFQENDSNITIKKKSYFKTFFKLQFPLVNN